MSDHLDNRVLDIEDLSYRYPNTDHDALSGVTLSVAAGEFVVLAGRSGSGKSTLVRAEIGLPLELRGETPARRARAVEEVALALAIPDLLERTTDTLSGGELQRVALAAALVARPALVLLDEPTSQLDPVAGEELVWLLRRLNEQWGTAVIVCEHRLERCLGAADRAVAMRDGAIVFDGPPGGFLEWALGSDQALATPG